MTDDTEKGAIIDRLTRRECKGVSPILLAQLDQHSVNIQVSIAFCMRELANKKAKLMICDILSREDLHEEVRGAFTEVVGHHNIQNCLPIMISQLNHPSPYIRFWTCDALGWLNPLNLEELIKPLLDDHEIGWDNQTVSESVQHALARYRD